MIYVLVLLYGIWGGEVGKSEYALVLPFKTAAECEAKRDGANPAIMDHPSMGHSTLFLAQCKEIELPK